MDPDLIPPHRKMSPIPPATLTERRLNQLINILDEVMPLPSHSERWVGTRVSELLMRDLIGYNAHKCNPEDISMDSRTLLSWFCHRPKLKAEIMPRYFDIDDRYDSLAGITKGYRAKKELKQALYDSEIVYKPIPSELISIPRVEIEKQPRGWYLPIPESISIDIGEIQRLREAALYVLSKVYTGGGLYIPATYAGLEPNLLTGNEGRAHRVLAVTNALIEIATESGTISQHFRQSVAGRYYGTGTSLQNVLNMVKSAALSGAFQYDIEACHHAIAYHYSKKHSLPNKYLAMYVDDRSSFREYLADDLYSDTGSIKRTLIAMAYGAERHPYGALKKILGVDSYNLALEHRYFNGMYGELQAIGDAMLGEAMRTVKSDNSGTRYMWNKANLVLNVSIKRRRAQKLAHLMQGIESLMLKAAISTNASTVLPEHDGWSARLEDCPEKAVQAIKYATGITVGVSVKQHGLREIQQ